MDNFKEELKAKREEIFKYLSECSEKSAFTINGREYKISKLSHQFRTEILSVYTQIEKNLEDGNFGFITEPTFKNIIKKIDNKITFEDELISKRSRHWEEFPEDYLDYISMSMKVICYPFFKTKLHTN